MLGTVCKMEGLPAKFNKTLQPCKVQQNLAAWMEDPRLSSSFSSETDRFLQIWDLVWLSATQNDIGYMPNITIEFMSMGIQPYSVTVLTFSFPMGMITR